MIEQKKHWTDDDFELALELEHDFELIQFELKDHIPKAPIVPNRFEKKMKRHASFKATELLKKDVIFGPALQLTLGALLLAAIAIGFIESVQQKLDHNQRDFNRTTVDNHWQVPLDPNDKAFVNQDWYLVEFTVDQSGRANSILIIKSCIRDQAQNCGWDMSYEKQVRNQIAGERYNKLGKQRQIIWLRDETKIHHLKQ